MKSKEFISICKESRTEHQEQVEINQYCGRKNIKMFAVPNGANKSVVARSQFKAEGLKAGVPDLFFPIPSNGYHGLFIELKKRAKTLKSGKKSYSGSKVSDAQKEWIRVLNENGYKAIVCYGADEAIAEIDEYLEEKMSFDEWKEIR